VSGTIRVGIAGWVYEPWRGSFYPPGLTQKHELAHASARLGVIEINATFYANQKRTSFANWAGQTPSRFMFTVKGPQLITHRTKLKNPDDPLANFFASGLFELGAKLGPIVWQLPPNLSFDPERIETFLQALPHTPRNAAALAARQDRIADPSLDASAVPALRHAIEARHASYQNPAFAALLSRYNVAMVIPDTVDWPDRRLTADFVYARLQGPARADATGYGEADLDEWSEQIAAWARDGRDVFAFFVHENKLDAPANAMALMARLGLHGPGQDA